MKILHIINSLNIGGAEKLITEILPSFQSIEDIEADLLLLQSKKTFFYEKVKASKVKVKTLTDGSVYNPILIFKLIPYIKKYDVIHAHLFPVQYFVVLAKIMSFSKAKLIFTEHSTNNRRMNSSQYKFIEKFIYRHYKKIICISDEVKFALKRALNIPDEKLLVINNGINIKQIEQADIADRKTFKFNDSNRLLIMVAAFRREKDQDTVIKVLKLLPQSYKLLLVGDGERRQILENLVNELNLSSQVNFLGFRNDVISLLKMSDIAILSSHWEGFGLAAAEAMACGIPVIASDVSGLNNIVDNGGLLFEKENVEDLKAKIILLENREFYSIIAERSVNKAKQYDITKMIDQYVKVYKDEM